MAIELVSCPACGRKNASDRTNCLSCGADLPSSNATEQKQVAAPWAAALGQRLNVWQRLWIFICVLWFVVVAFFPYGDRDSVLWLIVPYVALLNLPVSVAAFLSWAVPCAVLYAFGWAIDGVRRGFQEVDTPRRPSRVRLRLTPWWRGWLRVAIVGYLVSWPLSYTWLSPLDWYSMDQILRQLHTPLSPSFKGAWETVIARPEFLQLSRDERKRLAADFFDREITPLLRGAYWKREPFRTQFIEVSALSLEEMPIKQWYNPVEPIPYRDTESRVHIDVDSYRLYRDISIRALIFELGVLALIIPVVSTTRPVVSRLKGAEVIKQVGSHGKNLTLEKATKLAIISSVLLVTFSVFYFLVIYLPHKEAALLKLQKEEQAAKERKEAEEKSARENEAVMNKYHLDVCLSDAYEHYNTNWANNCKGVARRQQIGLQNCLNSGLGQNSCRSIWTPADDSPNCSLPLNLANSVDAGLKESKDECYKKYPQR